MTKRGFILPIGGAEDRSNESAVLNRFVELCGGEKARIAIIPTASQLEETGPAYQKVFTDLGAREPRVLAFKSRADAEREDWLDQLERADGVFLTGGNQLRLSTILGGTPASDLIRERNLTGLHVAGTSAGAAILSEHMIAFGEEGSTPRQGGVALAPGMGVLPSVIVDQHFSQRDRLGRLLTAVSYNPRLLGIGIDEDTAAVISPEGDLEVLGTGSVTVVDLSEVVFSSVGEVESNQPVSLLNVRLHLLAPGASYNLGSKEASFNS